MSKTVLCVVVGGVTFVAGLLASQLVNRAEATRNATPAAVPAAGENAGAATPRAFAIEGMMCQGCAESVAAALTQLPGVRSAKVSFPEKRAVVVAEPSQVSTEKIIAAVATAGYQARLAAAMPEAAPSTVARGASAKQPVLVNITRGPGQLHAVSMALGVAQSALKDGRKVIVFLNVDAPVLAAKNLGDDVKFADFPSVKRLLGDFIAGGGQVLICEHCAHLAKLTKANLVDGAKLVGHSELFALLPPDAIVFSY